MTNRSNTEALIADLCLNHAYCPKEVILQAADELEALITQEAHDPLIFASLDAKK